MRAARDGLLCSTLVCSLPFLPHCFDKFGGPWKLFYIRSRPAGPPDDALGRTHLRSDCETSSSCSPLGCFLNPAERLLGPLRDYVTSLLRLPNKETPLLLLRGRRDSRWVEQVSNDLLENYI